MLLINTATFLLKIIENYDLPEDLNAEIKSIAQLPEEFSPCRSSNNKIGALSSNKNNTAEKNFLKKYANKTVSEREVSSNHDFLAAVPLSRKSASDCALSDLSSSYWSAKVSANLNFQDTH